MITIKNIYDLAIKMGIESDLRGRNLVLKQLKNTKEKYQKLSKEKKEEFDREKLTNPYSDTRILFGDPNKKIKRIMVGVDIDTSELLLAKYLSDHSGKKIDLVMSHHPLGMALADLSDVMHLQADILAQYGVPINVAEGITKPRISEVSRGVSPINHNQAVDAAKLLNLSLVCVHTPCDNLAANYLDKEIKKEKPETIGEVIKFLKKIPEYKEAGKMKAGPKIFVGSQEARAGKIALTEITGGTSGAKEIYQHMAHVGIGTIIGMHMREEHRSEAEKAHVNVVIAGHMSSDSIGMNLFLDELEKKGIEIIPCSGLIRVKRFKKQ
jgi:putative NIF3 family GTP cyclohydrolase 1 type 2